MPMETRSTKKIFQVYLHQGQIRSHFRDLDLCGADRSLIYRDMRDLDHVRRIGSVRSRSYVHVCLGGICIIYFLGVNVCMWYIYGILAVCGTGKTEYIYMWYGKLAVSYDGTVSWIYYMAKFAWWHGMFQYIRSVVRIE